MTVDDGATATLVTDVLCALTCWTKAGVGVAAGVTAFDWAEAGPVPIALVAVTVNV